VVKKGTSKGRERGRPLPGSRTTWRSEVSENTGAVAPSVESRPERASGPDRGRRVRVPVADVAQRVPGGDSSAAQQFTIIVYTVSPICQAGTRFDCARHDRLELGLSMGTLVPLPRAGRRTT
jgi:hypothetical protein